jgi:GNAT superfamily N-acetyltransferase
VPTKSSRLSFRPASIAEALAAGLEDLAEANYEEVRLPGNPSALKVHWGAYQMAERRGDFFGVAAFCKGALAGYAGYTLQVPDHHQGVRWAFNRAMYMAPEHRGWGSLELLAEGEKLALAKGAQAVVQAVKEHHSTDGKRSSSLAVLLSRKGYDPYERHFVKFLG